MDRFSTEKKTTLDSPLTTIVTMIKKLNKDEQRTVKQIREHYEVERKLADKLRNASRKERRTLYSSLYEELFRLVPDLPILIRKKSPELQQKIVQRQIQILSSMLDENKSFLEVGPGSCALAFHVANFVKEVYAVDVSKTITESSNIPRNFKLLLSDGCSIPVPKNSIDIVYSNQLMEHIHPDDASNQLKNIFEALAPGGEYLCLTPNRLNGPHDISKYFDTVATGFHLKEYTVTELSMLFKNAGFSKVMMCIKVMNKYIRMPIFPVVLCESILKYLPIRLSHILANTYPLRPLLFIRLLGVKNDEKRAYRNRRKLY
ncbi:MAG: class I SAM-dependent methyltransferase [Candidatus Neomarinimicrobiota bacterium]